MLFKLALPQAAQLGLFFKIGKSVVHLFEGPELRTHYWEDREENAKAQHPVGFKLTTSLLRGVRSTAVLQLLTPFYNDSFLIIIGHSYHPPLPWNQCHSKSFFNFKEKKLRLIKIWAKVKLVQKSLIERKVDREKANWKENFCFEDRPISLRSKLLSPHCCLMKAKYESHLTWLFNQGLRN